MYYVIPIFTDPYLHPLHKDNGLSMLYVQDLDMKKESFFIIQKHPDSNRFLEDYTWLKEEMIVTPDATTLLHVYPFEFVIDLNSMWWLPTNKPLPVLIFKSSLLTSFLSLNLNV